MKQIALMLLLQVSAVIAARGQLPLEMTYNGDTIPLYGTDKDTLRACPGDSLTFKAFTDTLFMGKDTILSEELQYTWQFTQDDVIQDIGADSVRFPYEEGGGHFLHLRVNNYQDDTAGLAVVPVQVGLKPDFAETEILPDRSVCLGDTVSLIGNAAETNWKYNPPDTMQLDEPAEVTDVFLPAISPITFRSFNAYQTMDDLDSLESVCITMEHSNAEDVLIELTAPNDSVITLKEPSDTIAFMGEPVDDEESAIQGKGYRYCWSPEPGYATMNDEAGGHTYTYTDATDSTYTDKPYLPNEQSYTPHEPFQKLTGTPLNGDWSLTLRDTSAENNGFVFSWEINFKDTFYTPLMKYENTYNSDSNIWRGDGIKGATDDQGNNYAEPPELGNTNYRYEVISNWSCKHSQDYTAEVTQASFEANPQQGQADPELLVSFESTTEWAEKWTWYFGIEDEGGTGENPSYGYVKKGEYPVYLVAESAQGNTSRSDTVTIIVNVPEPKLELPNVFTPNGDTRNDVFVPKEIQALEQVNGKILNRWGRVVCEFHSQEELEQGWDGTLNNNGNVEAAPGTYYYVFSAKGKNNKEINKKGMLHLLRGK